MKLYFLTAVVILTLILAGCAKEAKEKVICDPPYTSNGSGCCWDANDNDICDAYEPAFEESLDETEPEEFNPVFVIEASFEKLTDGNIVLNKPIVSWLSNQEITEKINWIKENLPYEGVIDYKWVSDSELEVLVFTRAASKGSKIVRGDLISDDFVLRLFIYVQQCLEECPTLLQEDILLYKAKGLPKGYYYENITVEVVSEKLQ